MPGTANGDPIPDLQEEGSLAGFETLDALLEVFLAHIFALGQLLVSNLLLLHVIAFVKMPTYCGKHKLMVG